MNNEFLKYIKSRGYLHQCTNEIGVNKTLKNPTFGYIGLIVPQIVSMGSLLPLMLLRIYQKHGHKPILLLGGGTTLVGDPSGKDETRKILNENDIENNKKKLKKVLKSLYHSNLLTVLC